ncbi:hypothetical protein TcWFU_002755 [Taenia crassiceps]|uniref:Secreted protein n=1 Tax=Taenia crassiceps TaxID=6207 RepID=A0ABR4QKC2_9CEST
MVSLSLPPSGCLCMCVFFLIVQPVSRALSVFFAFNPPTHPSIHPPANQLSTRFVFPSILPFDRLVDQLGSAAQLFSHSPPLPLPPPPPLQPRPPWLSSTLSLAREQKSRIISICAFNRKVFRSSSFAFNILLM